MTADSGDQSDRDDSAADTGNAAPVLPPRQTRPTDVKSVYFSRVLVWYAGTSASVPRSVVSWIVAARYAEATYAWCCAFTNEVMPND